MKQLTIKIAHFLKFKYLPSFFKFVNINLYGPLWISKPDKSYLYVTMSRIIFQGIKKINFY